MIPDLSDDTELLKHNTCFCFFNSASSRSLGETQKRRKYFLKWNRVKCPPHSRLLARLPIGSKAVAERISKWAQKQWRYTILIMGLNLILDREAGI